MTDKQHRRIGPWLGHVQVNMPRGCPRCGGYMYLELVPAKDADEEFVIMELRCLSCGDRYILNAKFIRAR